MLASMLTCLQASMFAGRRDGRFRAGRGGGIWFTDARGTATVDRWFNALKVRWCLCGLWGRGGRFWAQKNRLGRVGLFEHLRRQGAQTELDFVAGSTLRLIRPVRQRNSCALNLPPAGAEFPQLQVGNPATKAAKKTQTATVK